MPQAKASLETLGQLLEFPSSPSAASNSPVEQTYAARQEKFRQTLGELSKALTEGITR
jgi:hypothetical protein